MEEKTYEDELIETMRPHIGHMALVQGHHRRKITEKSVRPGNVIMSYAGFVVHCVTCDRALSDQW